MTLEEFNNIVENRVKIILTSLMDKGREYTADDEDRLITFKSVANLRRTTVEDALGGMVSKQIDSLFNMISQTKNGIAGSPSLWEERIKDIINYMILLDAVLEDKK